MIISPMRFRAAAEAGALRPTDPPAWVAESLRSRLSIGLRHVPGSPDHRPRRQDDADEQEAGQ